VVAIDSWEADSAYPAGHYVRTLGPIGDRETETEVGPLWSLLPRVGCHARIRHTNQPIFYGHSIIQSLGC